MPFLFAALYGLFSGFFDVLPVSSFAHQSILQSVFGISDSPYFLRLLVHIASLSALIQYLRPLHISAIHTVWQNRPIVWWMPVQE